MIGRLLRRPLRRPRPPNGVNLVGYHGATSGLGDRVRELDRVLATAGIRYSRWDIEQTESGRHRPSGFDRVEPVAEDAAEDGIVFDTTIAVVTALAFPGLDWSHRTLVRNVDRVIGYWFWELEHVPGSPRPAIDMVDEIWVPTRFVHDAYGGATQRPVRVVALPIVAPEVAEIDRAGLALPSDRVVFLCSFDHLSSMERKHPIGVIEAFRRAFPSGDEPVHLVVKSINGDIRPGSGAALTAAVGDDPRIELRDGYVPDAEQAALIAAADVFVSLHRSEGLGLHIAEAMWLGTSVIATAYSGVLDLVDASCAELVDGPLVPVGDGQEAYPADAVWADPDLGQAAAAMRRLVDDPEHRAELVAAARARIEPLGDRGAASARVTGLLSARRRHR